MNEKIKEIWEKMNDSEKYGCKFNLFPHWALGYNLTREENIELMKLSEGETGKI